MSLVHVKFFDVKVERLEHAYASHAEDDLLFDPVRAVSAVEIIGQAPVLGRVLRKVGIQEEDGDLSARRLITM
jgi:hypothetical protein